MSTVPLSPQLGLKRAVTWTWRSEGQSDQEEEEATLLGWEGILSHPQGGHFRRTRGAGAGCDCACHEVTDGEELTRAPRPSASQSSTPTMPVIELGGDRIVAVQLGIQIFPRLSRTSGAGVPDFVTSVSPVPGQGQTGKQVKLQSPCRRCHRGTRRGQ